MTIRTESTVVVSASPIGAAVVLPDGRIRYTYYGSEPVSIPAPTGVVVSLALDGTGPLALLATGELVRWSLKGRWVMVGNLAERVTT